MEQENTNWDNVAKWYNKYISSRAYYHNEIIIPKTLELLNIKKCENVLDVGCGEGILTRELAKLGANVTGIDASKKLIDIAKRKTPQKYNINYLVCKAEKMDKIKDNSFDAICAILTIQNIEQVESAVKEMSRVIKQNGRMVWVLTHPCFRIPRQSGWGFDDKRKLQYRRIDLYMTPLKIPIRMHPGYAPDIYTWTFHRPLSFYFDILDKYGFFVKTLKEWVSEKESDRGSRKKAEDRARREIPMFLSILAIKVSN